MWHTIWSSTWTLLGPVLAIQVVILAFAIAIGAVRRQLGYRGYVEAGLGMQPELYTRAVRHDGHPPKRHSPKRHSPKRADDGSGRARTVGAPPWRNDVESAEVRQFWAYPARPYPAPGRRSRDKKR